MPAFSPTHLSSEALKNCFHLPLESSSALFFLHITSWNFLALTMHLQNFWLLVNFYIIKSKLLNIEIKIPQIWPLPLFSHACTLSLTQYILPKGGGEQLNISHNQFCPISVSLHQSAIELKFLPVEIVSFKIQFECHFLPRAFPNLFSCKRLLS